ESPWPRWRPLPDTNPQLNDKAQRMELRQLGEWGLIRRIQKSFSPSARSNLILGMGDDAAVIRISPGKSLLLTTDLLVEGIDFDPAISSYDQIGYKALAANLSDIAAM